MTVAEHGVDDGVSVIRLDDGKVNAFNPTSVAELNRALDDALAAPTHAVVLTGRTNVFSAGLDLKTLPGLPPSDRDRAIRDYMALMARLFVLGKPTVMAVSGHALAGGAVTLLTGDVRIGAEGDFKLGLNEVLIGIPLPTLVSGMAAAVLPVAQHIPVILHGTVYDPADAVRRGILHEIVPPAAVVATAVERARSLRSIRLDAYALSKRRMRQATVDAGMAALNAELGSLFGEVKPQ